MKKQKKSILSNKWILILKVVFACILLFLASFFFFQNMDDFWNDFSTTSPPLFLVPAFFFLGIICVCGYIIFLLMRVDDGKVYRSERFDIPYKIVYSLLILIISVRGFFIAPYLNVPIPIVVIGLCFGIANWMIPKLYFHDSEDF